MSDIIIRDYKRGDFDGINLLWEATGMGGSARADNEETIEETIRTGGKLIVLEDKKTGDIIGTSWLTIDGRRIYLHHFGIIPGHQGKGLSHILTEESLKYAKEKGLQIKLEVHIDNKIATELYKKYGFKYLGDYDVYIIRDIGDI